MSKSEAYDEGYRAGVLFHLDGKDREDNPYDDRLVNQSAETRKLVEMWQQGFEDAGQDS